MMKSKFRKGNEVMNDEDLMRLISDNPDKGIHEAMRMYGRAVNTICRSVLRGYDEGLVDEAVSDTFFKVWKNRDKFSPKTGQCVKSWIYSIARNASIDILRRAGYTMMSLDDEEMFEPAAEYSIEEDVQKKEAGRILHEVIEKLGEPDNQVFLMKYFLFMKNKDIAAKLEMSEKKIENILYRGKVKLKEMLVKRGITCYEE